MATDSRQENLKRLLGELQSNDPERCLNALQELRSLDYSSQAILRKCLKSQVLANRRIINRTMAA